MNKLEKYSILGNKNRRKLRDLIPLSKPFTIFIEPTNLCNFNCVQCPHGLDEYREKAGPLMNMSEECFVKIVSDLNKWRDDREPFLKVIRLYLEGEPLVNKNFCNMLKILKENNFAERIELVTNGSLLNKKVAEKIVECGLDYICISIYSINKEKNKQITNSEIDPELIKENVKYLKQVREYRRKDRPYIYAKIINTFNEQENEEFKKYYSTVVDEVAIQEPMDWNSSEEGKFIDKLYNDKSIAEDVKKKIASREERRVCPYPFHTLSIKSNGDVLVCCIDWLRGTKVGNVFENTLEEIWNGKLLYQFRKMHIEGRRSNNLSCEHCNYLNALREEDNLDELTLDKLK